MLNVCAHLPTFCSWLTSDSSIRRHCLTDHFYTPTKHLCLWFLNVPVLISSFSSKRTKSAWDVVISGLWLCCPVWVAEKYHDCGAISPFITWGRVWKHKTMLQTEKNWLGRTAKMKSYEIPFVHLKTFCRISVTADFWGCQQGNPVSSWNAREIKREGRPCTVPCMGRCSACLTPSTYSGEKGWECARSCCQRAAGSPICQIADLHIGEGFTPQTAPTRAVWPRPFRESITQTLIPNSGW